TLFKGDQFPIQLLDIGGILNWTEIEKEECVSFEAFNLTNDLWNRPVEITGPCDRYDAEVAFIWTSSYRLDGIDGDIAIFLQQVAPWFGDIGETIARAFIVARLHFADCKISQELRP